MQPHELIRAQRVLGLMNIDLANTLGVGKAIVSLWRCGHNRIPGAVALVIRMLMDMQPEAREQYIKRGHRDDE